MAFLQTVTSELVSGVIGEIAFDAPATVTAVTAAADVIIGSAVTYTSEADETVSSGGTNLFAGIAINPKTTAYQALSYTGTDDIVPAGHTVEAMTEGEIYVKLATTGATLGDLVYFTNATGALGHGTAGAGQTQIAGATVVRHNVSVETPTLAVIRLKN